MAEDPLTLLSGWTTVPFLAMVSCALLACPDPSTLRGIAWDGGAIASREKSERGSWDAIKDKVEGFALGKWVLKATRRYKLTESMYDGQFKMVTLWSRGLNKRRWVEEVIRDYTAHFEEHGDGSMPPDNFCTRLGMGLGDYFYMAGGGTILVLVPSVLAFLMSYNTPQKGLSCHSGTYLVYIITQIFESLLWAWEAWLKLIYGERWSEARTRAKTISWCGQMITGSFAILTTVLGTLFQLIGVYRTCVCKVILCFFSLSFPKPFRASKRLTHVE